MSHSSVTAFSHFFLLSTSSLLLKVIWNFMSSRVLFLSFWVNLYSPSSLPSPHVSSVHESGERSHTTLMPSLAFPFSLYSTAHTILLSVLSRKVLFDLEPVIFP